MERLRIRQIEQEMWSDLSIGTRLCDAALGGEAPVAAPQRVWPRLTGILCALLLPSVSHVPLAVAQDWPGPIQPRVFNGTVTFDYPAVGLLLRRADQSAAWSARCTVSLVEPGVALTAAHCVCDAQGGQCRPGGVHAPVLGNLRVLWQNAGLREIARVSLPDDFEFPDQDYAALGLAEPVSGIDPLPLAAEPPGAGVAGTIAGFGSAASLPLGTGIKRSGALVTASCGAQLDADLFLCWESSRSGDGANICAGDSGAPLMLPSADGGQEIAGIAGGGYGASDGEDLAFATSAAGQAAGIARAVQAVRPGVAEPAERIARATVLEDRLSTENARQLLGIEVPAGSARLVVAGNGDDDSGNGYRLRVAIGDPEDAGEVPCTSEQAGVFQACVIETPAPGVWYAAYEYRSGPGGAVQLSATALRPGRGLDIDADGRIDALSDALLLLRHLSRYTGGALVDGVLGSAAARTDPAAVGAYLDSPDCLEWLDVDADGDLRADTDAQLILRHLFGLSGEALTRGALGAGAARTEPAAIAEAIESLSF